ncbi:hypothetical protein D3C78_1376490 [compost metagenome]
MLKHHADFQPRLAQGIAFGSGDIETFNLNAAAAGRFQPVQQADQRAFTGAAVADDAVDLPGLDRQVDVIHCDNAALCAVKSFANVRKNDHREANPYLIHHRIPSGARHAGKGSASWDKGRRNLCCW